MATVQLSEKTKGKLLEVAAKLQIKRKRRISLDEAVKFLIGEYDVRGRDQELFDEFYGCLRTKGAEAYQVIMESRKIDEERIRRLERRFSSRR